MAFDNVLKIYDEQGNPVDYDILASDVKFNDGKDLPAKLTELEGEIGEGGYTPPQGGIPATDLAPAVQTSLGKADTAYQKPASGIPATDLADGVIPDTSNLATKTEVNTGLAAKVDKVTGKGLSTNDYTDADKAAVGTIGSKANDNVVVKSISVNGQNPQTPTEGNVNINVQGVKGDDGITPHIGQNGHWWLGTTDTGVNATGNDGQSITDADLVIGNALNGQGDVLGMSGAMRMKGNIDSLYASLNRLYTKLANMAFWDATDQAAAEPTELDWSVPKVTVTITNSIGAGAVIKRNGAAVSGSLQVDQGDELVLTVEPADADTELSNVTAAIDGGTAEALTNNTLTITHVNANTSIVFAGTAASNWDVAPKADVEEGGTVVRYGMQQGRSINSSYGYATAGLSGVNPSVIMSPASYPYNEKVFTSSTSGYSNNTNPGKATNCFFATGGKRYLNIKMELNSTEQTTGYDYKVAVGCYTSAVINNTKADITADTIDGHVGRIQYAVGNVTTFVWKLDLNTFATQNGKQAGDIAYIKLLMGKYTTGTSTGIDSRTWFDNVTLRYKFSDD